MHTDENIRGIARTGSDGSYLYTADGPVGLNSGSVVAQSAANRPITFVSWDNAARFANWMANGQPTGAQTAGTTEDGAYLIGATVTRRTTNPNTGAAPTYALPTLRLCDAEQHFAGQYRGEQQQSSECGSWR
jgi:heme-degrading monooxygenase HmoA